MTLETFVTMIAAAGACGGVVYSLSTGKSHRLRIPFFRKKATGRIECPIRGEGSECEVLESAKVRDDGAKQPIDVEMGFAGHALAGACAGVMLVSVCVSHFNFDLDPALIPDEPKSMAKPELPTGHAPEPNSTAPVVVASSSGVKPQPNSTRAGSKTATVLNSLAIAAIGGFLGLKLMNVLAEQALKKISQDVELLEKQSEQFRSELEMKTQRIAAMGRELQELEKVSTTMRGELHEKQDRIRILTTEFEEREKLLQAAQQATFAHLLRGNGDHSGAANAIEQSLKIKITKVGEFVNALVLRSNDQLEEAIKALDRALKLPADHVVKTDSSIYWNKACYLALLGVHNRSAVIDNLKRSIEIKPENRNDIKDESDLGPLRKDPSFMSEFGLQI